MYAQSLHLPTVQHLQLAQRTVNVTIIAAHQLGRRLCTVRRTLLHRISARRSGALLRHAERDRHFEHMLAAVGGAHFAGARIQASVRSTGWPCHAPARLPTHSRALAVLAAGANLRTDTKKMQLLLLRMLLAHSPRRSLTTPWPHVSNFISHVELYTFPSDAHVGPSFGALLQSTGHDSRIALVLLHGPTWANATAAVPTRHACTRNMHRFR